MNKLVDDNHPKNPAGIDDGVKLVKGSVLVFLGLVISFLFQFVSTIILSYLLGPAGLAPYGVILRLIVTVEQLVVFALPTIVSHLVAQKKENESGSILKTSLLVVLAFSFMGVLSFSILAGFLSDFLGLHGESFLLILFSLYLPLNGSVLILVNFLRGKLDYVKYSVGLMAPYVMTLLLHILSYRFFTFGPGVALSNILLANGITIILGIVANRSQLSCGTIDLRVATRMVKLAAPLVLVHVLFMLIESIDLLTLQVLSHSPSIVGVYFNTYTLASYARYAVEPVSLAILPLLSRRVARQNQEGVSSLVGVSVLIVFGFFAPLCLVAGASSLNILRIFFSASFQEGYPILTILMIGMPFLAGYYILARSMISQNRTKDVATVLVTATSLDVILTYVLSALWGSVGAAISTTITYLFMGILAYRKAGWKFGIERRDQLRIGGGLGILLPILLIFRHCLAGVLATGIMSNILVISALLLTSVVFLFVWKPFPHYYSHSMRRVLKLALPAGIVRNFGLSMVNLLSTSPPSD